MLARYIRLAVLAAVLVLPMPEVGAADILRIGGVGAANGMLQHVGAAFDAKTHDRLEIIPSLGSAGAISALADGALDVAVSGRMPNPEEARRGDIRLAATLATPFGLVTSRQNAGGLRSEEIAGIYMAENPTWPDKMPMRIILRPRAESDSMGLSVLFPNMAAALDQARQRADIPVAATDQDNADLAARVEGSLTAAALTQVTMEKRALRFVAIDGVEPTLSNLENGHYIYAKDLRILVREPIKPVVARFIAFLRSPESQRFLREADVMLVAD